MRYVLRCYLWAGLKHVVDLLFHWCLPLFSIAPNNFSGYYHLVLSTKVLHGITGQNGVAFAQFVSTVRKLAQGDTEQQGMILHTRVMTLQYLRLHSSQHRFSDFLPTLEARARAC